MKLGKKTSPVRRQRLGNQLYDILRDRIAEFRFLSGKKLDLEAIAEELEVSRPPLWEAVCRLEQEGLVVIKPNRGVWVAEISWSEAADTYQVRGQLEALAVSLAVPHIPARALKEMARHLEEHRRLIEDGDWYRFSPMDHQFHAVVYDYCGNEVLTDVLLGMKIKLGTLQLDIQPLLSDLYEQHAELYEALLAQDGERAATAIAEHNFYMETYCRELHKATTRRTVTAE